MGEQSPKNQIPKTKNQTGCIMAKKVISRVIDKIVWDVQYEDFVNIEDMLTELVTLDIKNKGKIVAILENYLSEN
jgi:hypothetical protein